MGGVVSAIGSVVGGAAKAVGSVVSGVAGAVGSVANALGPIGTMAAAYFGVPAFAPSGFAALEAPSILGGGMTGAGMLTSSSLGTALGTGGLMTGTIGAGAGLGSSLLSTAGGVGTSSSFLTNLGRAISSGLSGYGSSGTGSLLSTPSTGAIGGTSGSLGNFTNLLKSGMDIYNALNYGIGQSPTAAQASADPYAPYRQQAADKLNAVMNNPSLVYGLPGYRFAQEQQNKAINRTAAAGGNFASGNTLLAVQNQSAQTAQNWFDDYINKLSVQAGVNQSPSVGTNAYNTAAEMQSKAEKNRQTALLQGIMSGSAALSSFFG